MTGSVQAQAPSLQEECNYLVTTANQNLVEFAALETEPLAEFFRSTSQAASLAQVQAAANQYNVGIGELIDNINALSSDLRSSPFTDPVLEGYRRDYITVLSGLIDALTLEREAMTVVAATETDADLPQNLAAFEAQAAITTERFTDLANQELDILSAVDTHCGFTSTVEPPSPLQPLPSPTATPPSSTGNTGNNNGGGSTSATPPRIEGYDYTEAMLMGYTAAEVRDWHTALINFRRALAARPGDRYALAAIANMEAYIADERLIAARRQRFIDLQATLAEAVAIGDWACAAASVDELTTYYPANSLDRARLVTYRGEITGFIEARDRVENWSSVCPG